MFNQKKLEQLLEAMRKNGVTTLEVETEDDRLRLGLPPALLQSTALEETHSVTLAVKTAAIGIFLPRGSDDGLPELARDAAVLEGELLGYVSRGTMRVPIVSPSAGILIGAFPEEGAILGYGDTAFLVEIRQ